MQPCGFIRSLDVIGVRPRGLCFKLVSDKLEARVELDRRSLEKAAHFHQANGWNSQKEYQKGPFHAVWPNLIVDRMTARRGLLEVTVLGDHIIADVEVLGCCSHH